MKIGTSLHLEMKNPTTNKAERYRCKIIEKNEEFLFIDYPININTRKTAFFSIGTNFIATYVDDNHNLYSFPVKLLTKVNLTVPTLTIKMPDKDDMKRIQRREYVRIETAIDVAVHCSEDSFTPFTTVTLDISAGGMLAIIPRGITSLGEKPLKIWMVLEMESGKFEYIYTLAKLIRMESSDDTLRVASLKFDSITKETQQKVIYYCFERQRKVRTDAL